MSGPATSRSPRPRTGAGRAGRRRERGGVSWVTLLLVVLVGGGGYLAWVWMPLYFDHWAVKQVVTDYMNQAIKNPDDAFLRRNMVHKIHALSQVPSVDAYGQAVRVPAIPVDEQAVVWERDASAKTLHVAFEYERQVVYPFLNRADVKTFSVDKTGDLSLPDWGPAR